MLDIIITTFFLGSIIGIGIISFKKIPILIELPETNLSLSFKDNILNLKEKVIHFNPFKNFSFENFLQKILSKIRIFILKIENLIANYIKILRQKSQKKREKINDNYWEKIKKIK